MRRIIILKAEVILVLMLKFGVLQVLLHALFMLQAKVVLVTVL
jgi:hypothetical protein